MIPNTINSLFMFGSIGLYPPELDLSMTKREGFVVVALPSWPAKQKVV